MIEFEGIETSHKPATEKKAQPDVMTLPHPPAFSHSSSASPKSADIFPVGRPSKFSWALAKTICLRIQNGEVLSKICQEQDMPSHSVVNLWMKKLPKFNQLIERSRVVSADKIAEDSMSMFDDPPPMETVYTKNGSYERISMSGVQLMRYKSQAKQWLASKFSPDKYGDKLNVSNAFDITSVLTTINGAKLSKKIKQAQQPAIDVPSEPAAPSSIG